jgi:hypothetical protein
MAAPFGKIASGTGGIQKDEYAMPSQKRGVA